MARDLRSIPARQRKLVVDGGGICEFSADQGTLDLTSTLDQLIVHAKPDDTAYDMTKIVDGQLTLGVFNSVTEGITVTYVDGDIFISGRPTPEPVAAVSLAGVLSCRRRRRAAA